MDTDAIIEAVLEEYRLPWFGMHGLSHWGRVLENGLRLAESTGANTDVVTLFAFFHDARRLNEGFDPGHGLRGAEFAASMRGDVPSKGGKRNTVPKGGKRNLFELDDLEFHLLSDACVRHTDGLTRAHVTVQTCWDADRLDLGRVGVTPRPGRLCTDVAKTPEMIRWAHRRAVADRMPECVAHFWRPFGQPEQRS